MKTATIGFGNKYAEYYERFNSLSEAVRFVSNYEGETPIYNLMYDGDEYFNASENIKRIAKENHINVGGM